MGRGGELVPVFHFSKTVVHEQGQISLNIFYSTISYIYTRQSQIESDIFPVLVLSDASKDSSFSDLIFIVYQKFLIQF